MQCPNDGKSLKDEPLLGVIIDICPGCDGIWMDAGELQRILNLDLPRQSNLVTDARDSQKLCPSCGGALQQGNYWEDSGLKLESCSACQGIWLDGGKLSQLLPRRRADALKSSTVHLLSRYKLGEAFLEGRFSTLFRAEDRLTGASVVVRSMKTGGQLNEVRPQVFREGRLLARMNHRNLPRVLETVEEGEQVYLILEDFHGETLEAQLKTSPNGLEPELIGRYLEQLLAVMAHLHAQSPPIIHRDLRPDTILVTPHGVLKLAEFGFARISEDGTAAGTVFRSQGHKNYASAEQLLGMPSSPANDLYSAGAVLYTLATGQVPGPTMERVRTTTDLTAITELRPGFPGPLAELIMDLVNARLLTTEAAQGRLFDLGETSTQVSLPRVLLKPGGDGAQPLLAGAKKLLGKLSSWELLFGSKAKAATPTSALPSTPTAAEVDQYPFVDLTQRDVARDKCRMLSHKVCKVIEGICLGLTPEGEILVAVKDPTQVYIYDYVKMAVEGRYRARLLRADARLLSMAREYLYEVPDFKAGLTWSQWLERKKFDSQTLEVKSQVAEVRGEDDIPSPIVAAVDGVIREAIAMGASDIHLESFEHEMMVRYRVDGVLLELSRFPSDQGRPMVKRVKIMANMDIAQDRVTQGGRISVKLATQEIDLRVSVVPVPYGENVVMRILRKGTFTLRIQDLGLGTSDLAKVQKVLAQPYGLFLVSGPTGSGKSTTLYASLAELSRPDRKLITVEDPIEYQMPPITQVQVNMAPQEEEKRVSFARALREFLRQNPDVIMVGEIRDSETAKIAVQASLTGHLVLSTIHTNDSVGIVARLRDMGVEPYLIGSTLVCGVAQRLARRICKSCRDEVSVPDRIAQKLVAAGVAKPQLFRGRGCLECHHTGYRGRLAVYEVLEINEEIRELICISARDEELRRASQRNGLCTLYQDGLLKANEGLITLEEVERVCMTL